MYEGLLMEALEYLVRIVVIGVFAMIGFFVRKYSLERWIIKAVKAAEVIYGPGTGPKKLAYVLGFVRDNYKWFKFSDAQLSILINAAVDEINKRKNVIYADEGQ